jgi:hypothetical protein
MAFARMLFLALFLFAAGAQAQDRFEIQVYDSEVAQAGQPGLEMHLNYVASGSHTVSPEGELPTSHVLHLTLEPHLGVFGWGELGGYLQGALQPDGTFDYAGVKLRFKAKWPEKLFGVVGLALNAELSLIPAAYEQNRWGSELRPIIDARLGVLYASINPILSTDLAGPAGGHPQFDPAAKAGLFVLENLSLGGEYYAGLGTIDSPLPVAAQNHRLFGALDFSSASFDVNFGVGRGFGEGDRWVAKAIFGVHPHE